MKQSTSLAHALCALLFTSSAMAKTLYVGSGAGQIHSFSLANGAFTKISSTNDSFPAPTWQTIAGNYLYSVSESGEGVPGAITAYTIADGKFTKKSVATGLSGPVHIAAINKGTGLITAAYGGHGINTFTATYGTLKRNQQFNYTSGSNAVPARQKDSHPHQVVVDPTGRFAVIPDLGSDLLRVYLIKGSSTTSNLRSVGDVATKKGSGPRHGVFWPGNGTKPATHFFQVAELDNTITAYKLTYGAETLTFDNKSTTVYNTFGDAKSMPTTTPAPAAGEIAISPDDKFLYVSNRLDRFFKGPPAQDAMAAWAINADGTLKFIELTPAGGQNPRHFSFVTIDGKDYVTIANPASDNVSMFTRDTATGKLGQKPYASMNVTGAACVQWK